jgi:DNA-binding transcriptional LysR family regulator
LGFAFLPEHWVLDALAQGQVQLLSLADAEPRRVGLSLVKTDGEMAGRATNLLAQVLLERFKNAP